MIFNHQSLQEHPIRFQKIYRFIRCGWMVDPPQKVMIHCLWPKNEENDKEEVMAQPLMPKATAVWLVDNTSLTFEQISHFCSMHPLEIKGIADGDVAQGIKGLDPVATGQLTREQIEQAEENPELVLTLLKSDHDVPERKKRRGPRYTPLSRRQDRPDAIYWMVRNHPEISDAQISKLIGTTKPTIQTIRDRTHWNSSNLKPIDPVALGLCSQTELDDVVRKASAKKARAEEKIRKAAIKAGTIKPTEETLKPTETPAPPIGGLIKADDMPKESTPSLSESAENVFSQSSQKVEKSEEEPAFDPDSVFATLKTKPEADSQGTDGENT